MNEKQEEGMLRAMWGGKNKAQPVGASNSTDLLSVTVSYQGGNTTMISIGYMDGGLRKTLTISDTSRSSRFRMDKLKELLDR